MTTVGRLTNALPGPESEEMERPAPSMSIIMSVCDSDREHELREAIESLLAQTYRDFEIVLVADCTRPDLRECVKGFAARHSFFRVITTLERLSHGGALNLAIHNSRGRYIVRMDSDDLSRPERLARFAQFFEANPEVDVVGSFVEEFYPDRGTLGVIEYPLHHQEIRKFILRRNPVAHAAVAQKAEATDKIGTYVRYSIRNEDTLYWLNALMAGVRFANIPEPLYRVRYAQANNRRRTGIKKAVSDLVDRLRIILDLGGGWTDVLFALCVCLVQSCPPRVYQAVRSSVVHVKWRSRSKEIQFNS